MAYPKKIILLVVLLLLTFAVGRYTAPKTTNTSKTTTTTDETTKKITTIVKDPNGKEVTTIIEHDQKHENEVQKDTTVTIPKQATINLSGLVGSDITHLKPLYGVSASKQVIGPITAGVFGLSNGIVGVSVGFNF